MSKFPTDTWMTRRGKQQLAVFTSIQDILLLLQFCVLLTLPISTTLFFIFSPDHPLHSRQLLPEEYGLNENIICTIVFIATTTWVSCISWYTILWFVVAGTIYICE